MARQVSLADYTRRIATLRLNEDQVARLQSYGKAFGNDGLNFTSSRISLKIVCIEHVFTETTYKTSLKLVSKETCHQQAWLILGLVLQSVVRVHVTQFCAKAGFNFI